MRRIRLPLRAARPAVAVAPLLACSGCDMLGALFDTHVIGGIALVVAVIAALGFIISRATRR